MSNERPKIGLSGLVLAQVLSDDENGIVYVVAVSELFPGKGCPQVENFRCRLGFSG